MRLRHLFTGLVICFFVTPLCADTPEEDDLELDDSATYSQAALSLSSDRNKNRTLGADAAVALNASMRLLLGVSRITSEATEDSAATASESLNLGVSAKFGDEFSLSASYDYWGERESFSSKGGSVRASYSSQNWTLSTSVGASHFQVADLGVLAEQGNSYQSFGGEIGYYGLGSFGIYFGATTYRFSDSAKTLAVVFNESDSIGAQTLASSFASTQKYLGVAYYGDGWSLDLSGTRQFALLDEVTYDSVALTLSKDLFEAWAIDLELGSSRSTDSDSIFSGGLTLTYVW